MSVLKRRKRCVKSKKVIKIKLVSILYAWGSLCVLFLMSGCMVTSEFPLEEYDPKKFNDGILGVWINKDETTTLIIHGKNFGRYEVVCVLNEDGKVDVLRYKFYLSQLDGKNYANLKQVLENDQASTTFELVRYEFQDKNELKIIMPDTAVFKKAVQTGGIKGDYKVFVNIRDDIAHLSAFVRNHQNSFPSEGGMIFYKAISVEPKE
ncbi:MAG: hypothetical protein HYS07_08765 [Chlamydiae bacterium]|nr:hypothetical protein [Chlamydiota bacterium]MBI3276989.1 hypothetical protein [Chlamydiota bacterium]